MQKYSAGFTSERPVKDEMKLVVELYLQGKTKNEVRDIVIEQNLFNMRGIPAIKETLGKINRRVSFLDDSIRKIFIDNKNNDADAILLYTFLESFRIASEFVMEVIHYNWKNHKKIITLGDVNIFMEEKAKQSELVANWSPATTNRIRNRILEFCTVCGLLYKTNGDLMITPITISKELREYIDINEDYKNMLTYILIE